MREKYRPIEWILGFFFWGILAVSLIAFVSDCSGDGSAPKPGGPSGARTPTIDPYPGYRDGVDQDCADLLPQKNIYVGGYDPDNLDRDGDGWGCEG